MGTNFGTNSNMRIVRFNANIYAFRLLFDEVSSLHTYTAICKKFNAKKIPS